METKAISKIHRRNRTYMIWDLIRETLKQKLRMRNQVQGQSTWKKGQDPIYQFKWKAKGRMEESERTLSTDRSNDNCEWGQHQHYTDIQQKRNAGTQMNLYRSGFLPWSLW